MTDDDLRALLPALQAFHARCHPFFCRTEGRAWSEEYLAGLTLPMERKNVEKIAEQADGAPRKLQEFFSDSAWDDQRCISELQRFAGEQFGAANGGLILDDSGFAKQGTHSAGVARQYAGTLGRADNCQAGVFLGCASPPGYTPVDGRLYLHRSWLDGPAKRNSPRAAVPAGVGFKTKLELAAELLQAATERGHFALPVGDRGRRLWGQPRAACPDRGVGPLVLLRGQPEYGGRARRAELAGATTHRSARKTPHPGTADGWIAAGAGGRRQHRPAARHGLDSTPGDGRGHGAARLRVRPPARD